MICIAIGLVTFLILVLCVPVETTISIDTESKKKYSLKISWLFGIVKIDLIKRRLRQIKKQKLPKRKRRLLSSRDIRILTTVTNPIGLLKRCKDFIASTFHQLRIKEITGNFVVGLEDPAYTGMLFAIIGPANAMLNLHPKYNVTIRPFFDNENILLGNLNGNIKVQPIRLVCPALKLVTSKEVRKFGNNYIKKKLRNL